MHLPWESLCIKLPGELSLVCGVSLLQSVLTSCACQPLTDSLKTLRRDRSYIRTMKFSMLAAVLAFLATEVGRPNPELRNDFAFRLQLRVETLYLESHPEF